VIIREHLPGEVLPSENHASAVEGTPKDTVDQSLHDAGLAPMGSRAPSDGPELVNSQTTGDTATLGVQGADMSSSFACTYKYCSKGFCY